METKRKPPNRSSASMRQMADHKAKQRAEWKEFALKKLGNRCSMCRSVNDLHFDHVDMSQKSFCISKAPTKQKLIEELEKCQLLCKDCHREKSNREISGEECYASKLTHLQVKEIILRLQKGESGISLSKEFGVGPMQISRIKNGKQWRYMTDDI